ncbi:MAG TPA: hypothetical protein VNG89_10555 [Vicinamibacterales bacterium]|nr:hypothetical protein [Vicinamibacterales bacterium]
MRIVATLASTVVLATLLIGDPIAETLTVPAGGDLQNALNRARPGDTITLARGATYVGNFTLPAKEASDRVITVRTAGDEGFPADGERMTPAAAEQLAKLRSPSGSPALATAPGTHGWRLSLLEFLPNRSAASDIITLGDGGKAQNALDKVPSAITLDRLYVHGDPERGQKRAIALNSSETTITGCYVSDIKAIGQDSQAIGGWNGPGGYTIENNYLEAAGENVMFGGADPAIPDLTPTRIVVRGNLLSKPLAWRAAEGPRWQVKNVFELKNARGVLVEHNVIERSWQQAQSGYAVLFTVRNQDGACPWCQVEDVEFRYNLVRDVAAAIQVLGTDPNHPSRQTNNIRIHDNVFDGIDREAWGGDGYFMLLTNAPRDIVVDHNTIVVQAGLVKIARGVSPEIRFTNNVATHGTYGIIGTGHGIGNDSIAAFLPGATIAHNVLAGGKASAYPSDNLFPTLEELQKQFVAFSARSYQLAPGSAWHRAGSDGRDLGADLSRVAEPPRRGSN